MKDARNILWLGCSIVLLGLCLGAIWLLAVGARSPFDAVSADWESFAKVAGVIVPAFGAILAAMAAMASIKSAREIETFKVHTARDLEKIKLILAMGVRAHGDLYLAALKYYRKLARLELGEFDISGVQAASDKMEEVEGLTVYVDDGYKDQWYLFWQTAKFVEESVRQNISEKERRIEFWRNQVCRLGEMLDSLRKGYQELMRI